MKIGILTAMEKEAASMIEALPEEIQSKILTFNCGIGKVNAAIGAMEMIASGRPECILSIGCAGSMDATMRTSDILIASRVAYHDVWCGADVGAGRVQGLPQFFEADPKLLLAAENAACGCKSCKTGLLVTGDQFFVSLEEDKRIKGLYPSAMAADMESAAMAQVCYLNNIPFLSIRIISDSHDNAQTQEADYNGFWGREQSVFRTFLASLIKELSC